MKKFKQIISLAKTPTAKNTYLVFTGNAFAGFIGMILMIIISRTLGPSQFGVFSVSFSLFMLLSKFGDLGFNFAMVRNISRSRAQGKKQRIKRIFETVLFSKTVLSLFIASVGFFAADFISIKLFNLEAAAAVNRWVILLFFVFVLYDTIKVFFQANKRFFESVLMYIISNLLKLIMLGLLIVFLPHFKNFIFIYLAGPFITGLVFAPRINLKLRFKLHLPELKRLLKFSSWMAVAVAFAAIAENLNIFMVARNLSSYEAGIYSAAEKFILLFSIFTGALGTVLISRTSEFLEISHIKKFLKKVFVLQVILFFAFVALVPLANFLPLLLGAEYRPSIGVLQILIVASFFRMAITPLDSLFYPLGKSVIFAIDAVLHVIILLTLNQRLLPLFQARGAAISFLVANITTFVLNFAFLFFILKKNEKKASYLG